MNQKSTRRIKWALVIAASLSGGSVFSNCQTRFKESAFDGLESYILNDLLNPANFLPAFEDDAEGDTAP